MMNRTTNYKLCQWEADDKIQRTDFNADNAKIDAAIAAAVTRFATGTYRGTGEYGEAHPNSLTFDFQPKIVVVQGVGVLAILPWGVEQVQIICTNKQGELRTMPWALTWEGNTLSWYLNGSSSGIDSDRGQGNYPAAYSYFVLA